MRKKSISKTVEIFPRKRAGITIGASSIIGTRRSQEDTIFSSQNGSEAIAIVCDGMGGLAGGAMASRLAAESMADAWFIKNEINKVADIPGFLKEEAIRADEKVYSQKNEQGGQMAGTTIVMIIVRNNELYWLSVGDSKVYIIRGEEILPVCKEHNYRLMLDTQLKQGMLTEKEYAAQEYRAEALISYLGMGDVSLMDINQKPFLLYEGDIILLSSDGLYRSLTDKEILNIIKGHVPDMQNAALALTNAALDAKATGQDNTSVVVLQYQDRKSVV